MVAAHVGMVVLGYLMGMFPTAELIGRRTGHDPTAEGSHNPGATNVYRTSGRVAGVLVLLGDAAKGALAAGLGWALCGRLTGVAAGAAAVLGHVFPATRHFKGGKGVATGTGMAVVLYPWLSLVLLVVFAVVVAVSRRVSVGSLTLAVLLPMGVGLTDHGAAETLIVSGVSLVVIARHHENIRRLLRREEATIR